MLFFCKSNIFTKKGTYKKVIFSTAASSKSTAVKIMPPKKTKSKANSYPAKGDEVVLDSASVWKIVSSMDEGDKFFLVWKAPGGAWIWEDSGVVDKKCDITLPTSDVNRYASVRMVSDGKFYMFPMDGENGTEIIQYLRILRKNPCQC